MPSQRRPKSVNEFEKRFSELSKIKYSVGCASGTDALILSLMSLNLRKGDEIIVPGMSYISTGLSVILNNNKLIFVDIDNKTGLISIDKVADKLTKKTKAIIPVNLYGQKVDLKKLREVVGSKMTIIEEPNRPGDPEYLVADKTKAGKLLNWYSTQSSIDNIVSTAVKWYNKLNKKNIQ